MSDLEAAARELRPRLSERAAETAERGVHDDATHALLRQRGLCAMLLDPAGPGLDGFTCAVAELARGCPTTARAVADLGAGAARVRAAFGDEAAAALFADGAPCIVPASAGALRASRTATGWSLAGTLETGAAARHASWLIAPAAASAEAEATLVAIVPAAGAGGTVAVDAEVEQRFLAPVPHAPDPWSGSLMPVALAAVLLGCARAAVELHDEIVRDGHTPAGPRALDPDWQRWLGAAVAHAQTAELLLYEAIAQHAQTGDDLRLGMLARESMRLSWAAVQVPLRTAGPLPSEREAALDRLGRAVLRGLHDPALAPEESSARMLARRRLGLALDG